MRKEIEKNGGKFNGFRTPKELISQTLILSFLRSVTNQKLNFIISSGEY